MRTLAFSVATLLSLAANAQPANVGSSVAAGPVPYLPFPTGNTQTINILEWDTNQLPKIFQRSDQLPLTEEDLKKLAKAGFDGPSMVKMVEQRRCACDASADGLIRLKEAGVPKEVLEAVSLHALKPNRALALWVTLDFAGARTPASTGQPAAMAVPRQSFLYVFVDDGQFTRTFSMPLADVFSRRFTHDAMIDRSDLLLTREVRRVEFSGELPLKQYGKHQVMVVASGNPAVTHPNDLTEAERKTAQVYTFDYPRSSLQSVCRLVAGYQRDVALQNRFHLAKSRFECEFE